MRLGIIVMASLALGLVACGPSIEDNCETFCEKDAECNEAQEDSCIEDCTADMEDADGDCQDAFAEAVDCLDEASCSEATDECFSELLTFMGKCEEFLEE